MERRVVPTHLRAVEILACRPAPPLIVTSVSKDVEHPATGDVKEALRDKMDAHADHTVHVVKDESIPQRQYCL